MDHPILTTSERDKIAAARLAAVRQMPYLATALFALQPRASAEVATLGVSRGYALRVNRAALAARSVPSLAAGLIHEVCHLLRRHASRAEAAGVGDWQHALWNVAADAEINDDLGELPEAPEWWVRPATLGAPEGLLAEEYYRRLCESGGCAENGSDQGAGAGAPPDCGPGCYGGDGDSDASVSGTVSARGANAIARQVAAETIEAAKSRGNVPGGMLRWAEELLAAPQVDWRAELAAMVRGAWATVAGAVDYDYRRPSRRTSHLGAPRALLASMCRPVPKAAVVIDTSGSMDRDDLGAALAELQGILKDVGAPSTSVYACDAAVGPAQQVFDARDVALSGGGGTDMRVGIDAALADRSDVVVVLTDCQTPWPDEAPSAPVIVGAITEDVPDGVPEWARVVHIAPSRPADEGTA